MKLASVSLCLLLLTLTATAANAQWPKPDFAALRHTWIQALESRNLEKSLATYDAQATFINPDGTHANGNELRKLFAGVFSAFRAKIDMKPRTTEFSGNLAYDSGSYDEAIEDVKTGSPHHTSGDYLTVYRRNRQGNWLIVQQVWTEAGTGVH